MGNNYADKDYKWIVTESKKNLIKQKQKVCMML